MRIENREPPTPELCARMLSVRDALREHAMSLEAILQEHQSSLPDDEDHALNQVWLYLDYIQSNTDHIWRYIDRQFAKNSESIEQREFIEYVQSIAATRPTSSDESTSGTSDGEQHSDVVAEMYPSFECSLDEVCHRRQTLEIGVFSGETEPGNLAEHTPESPTVAHGVLDARAGTEHPAGTVRTDGVPEQQDR